MLLSDGVHIEVVTSYVTSRVGSVPRSNAKLYRSLAQPPPHKEPLTLRQSTRAAAVEARHRMEAEVIEEATDTRYGLYGFCFQQQRQYAIDLQRQKDREAREQNRRTTLPPLDPPQSSHCQTRNSHRHGMAGCAGRDVNHKVEYFNLGPFDKHCPWGCGAVYMQCQHAKLARPLADGTASSGHVTKCCKNSQTSTDHMRNVNALLNNPPPIIKVCNLHSPPAS